MSQSELCGIGGDRYPRETELSRKCDRIHNLWVGGGFAAQKSDRSMSIVVPSLEFRLHLRVWHVAAVFSFG
jgi:hypothetical protein